MQIWSGASRAYRGAAPGAKAGIRAEGCTALGAEVSCLVHKWLRVLILARRGTLLRAPTWFKTI